MVVCANFNDVFGDTKLQTLSSYNSAVEQRCQNYVAPKMNCKCVGNEVGVAA